MKNPYTYRAVGQGIGQSAKRYDIYFNEKKVKEIHNLMLRDIKSWVQLLNEAYQNGQNK